METISKLFQRKEPHVKASKGCMFTHIEQDILAQKNLVKLSQLFPNDFEEYSNREFKKTLYYGEEEE